MKKIYIRTINSNMIRLYQLIFLNLVFTAMYNGSAMNGEKGYTFEIKKRSNTAL